MRIAVSQFQRVYTFTYKYMYLQHVVGFKSTQARQPPKQGSSLDPYCVYKVSSGVCTHASHSILHSLLKAGHPSEVSVHILLVWPFSPCFS